MLGKPITTKKKENEESGSTNLVVRGILADFLEPKERKKFSSKHKRIQSLKICINYEATKEYDLHKTSNAPCGKSFN